MTTERILPYCQSKIISSDELESISAAGFTQMSTLNPTPHGMENDYSVDI